LIPWKSGFRICIYDGSGDLVDLNNGHMPFPGASCETRADARPPSREVAINIIALVFADKSRHHRGDGSSSPRDRITLSKWLKDDENDDDDHDQRWYFIDHTKEFTVLCIPITGEYSYERR